MMDTAQVLASVQDMLGTRQKPHGTHTATCATVNPLRQQLWRGDRQEDTNNTREG